MYWYWYGIFEYDLLWNLGLQDRCFFFWVGLRFRMIFVLHFGHPRSFYRSCQFLIDYLYKTVPNDMSAIPEGRFACRFD